MRVIAHVLWRTHRLEAAILGLASFALAVTGLLAATVLTGLTTPECVALLPGGYSPAQSAACPGLAEYHDLRGLAATLSFLIVVMPALAGVVLGSGLVAGELDAGTLQLAWSLEPTRHRWFFERLVAGGLFVGAIGTAIAVVATPLAAAENLDIDIGASFLAYGLWGPLPLMRGLAAFGVGTLAGSLVGRSLPALILSALLAIIVISGSLIVAGATYPTQLTTGVVDRNALVAGVGFVGPDGEFLTQAAALERAPPGLSDPDRYAWLDARYEAAAKAVAGSEMSRVAFREGLLLAILTVVATGLASLVVARRRPL